RTDMWRRRTKQRRWQVRGRTAATSRRKDGSAWKTRDVDHGLTCSGRSGKVMSMWTAAGVRNGQPFGSVNQSARRNGSLIRAPLQPGSATATSVDGGGRFGRSERAGRVA